MKRIYHPYKLWEDWQAGMWRTVTQEEEIAILPKAVEFTGNAELYGSFMLKVVDSWPFACEHNLSELSMNRRAWIGHAAACLAFGCPEYITRRAWWMLSQQQRDEADEKATIAIRLWEQRNTKQATLFDGVSYEAIR